ncbi:hypothetical protein AMQ83_22415, partial [Paenibacillus riograndensis]
MAEEKFGYLRSECVRLCLRISTANSGTNQEICRQQWPEVQTFSVVTINPEIKNHKFNLYTRDIYNKRRNLSINQEHVKQMEAAIHAVNHSNDSIFYFIACRLS